MKIYKFHTNRTGRGERYKQWFGVLWLALKKSCLSQVSEKENKWRFVGASVMMTKGQRSERSRQAGDPGGLAVPQSQIYFTDALNTHKIC